LRIVFFSALTLFVIASPAVALLTDQEPSNNSMSTATIQFTPRTNLDSDAGTFTFFVGGGDHDFIGIGGLLAGDVVTVLSTPMVDAPNFEMPDTIVGLFNSTGNVLCIGDDSFNNDLDDIPMGLGGLCRLEIPSDGEYFAGVTGFSAVPFDGAHFEEGEYLLSVTVLPEPGLPLQLASGLLGLVVLYKRRRCANRERERRADTPISRYPSEECLGRGLTTDF
jgi:hypothetical protein